eukprot:6070264-Prymnesium_polylepis.1
MARSLRRRPAATRHGHPSHRAARRRRRRRGIRCSSVRQLGGHAVQGARRQEILRERRCQQ